MYIMKNIYVYFEEKKPSFLVYYDGYLYLSVLYYY